MKLEFKTVKEFFNFLTQDDLSFVLTHDPTADYLAFEVGLNAISVYTFSSEKGWDVDREFIDSIYGTFFQGGGILQLSSDNVWELSFKITDESFSIGYIYKIKCPEKDLNNTPQKFIEL